jgi:SAM-dependent methyltransferase
MDLMTLEAAERLSRAWNNEFVRREGWHDHTLNDPVEAIGIFLDRLRGPRMLDAGCGWARYVNRFRDHGVEYTGIDHSDVAIELARRTHPGIRFDVGSIAEMPYVSGSFDGIWSCCTLGSIPKFALVHVLREHARVLEKDGVAMFVIPVPPYGLSEEGTYINGNGTPSIYQAHYDLDEFKEYLPRTGLLAIGSDIDWDRGSQYVLAWRPG